MYQIYEMASFPKFKPQLIYPIIYDYVFYVDMYYGAAIIQFPLVPICRSDPKSSLDYHGFYFIP